ncbi:glycosyltransferase [Lewinella sp. IMCC34183]|uniref:glycosyltransferase n=1 Tax=Lewinella sp. IMCC34183 TaxID=2248762 RepID=UPI0018E53C2E|nr:glycosyltransferase [Lewinella sp. IMCC34183]
MKLLFFNGSLKAGGAERSLSRLLNFLAGEGHEVHLVLRLDIIQFALDPGIHVHFLTNYKGVNKGHTVLKLRKRLKETIDSVRPDRVCAYSSLAGVLLAMTFTSGTIVRFDTYPRALMKWKQALFYSFFNLPHLKCIVCLTEGTKRDLRNLLTVNDLVVIHNASVSIATAREKQQVAAERPTSRPYLAALGRLSAAKAYRDALDAYARAKVYESMDFVFIGDGVERENLEQQATDLGVGDHVHFVGHTTEPFPILGNAEFLVHTSVREGFPNVFVEALSLGVPVLATDCKSGPAEIIQEGVNGFLVPVHDVAAIAERMHELATDDALRTRLAQQAPQTIERFSEEKIFSQWLEVLA